MPAPIHLLLPLSAFETLLRLCEPTTRVYDYLINGIIENNEYGQPQIRIFCDQPRAESIFAYAHDARPDLRSLIRVVVPGADPILRE